MPIPNRQQCLDTLAAAQAVGIPKDLAEALIEAMFKGSADADDVHAQALAKVEAFKTLKASCRVLGAPPDAAELLVRAGMPTIDAARETILKYAGRDLLMTPQRGHDMRLHLVALAATQRPRRGGALWS